MNKIVKISFVCASLFAFVNAQAQIIESVSFTPAKKGNYRTLATKSVTSFAGNLQVTEIHGLGQELILDTGSNIPFSGTNFTAARDVYMPAAAVIGNTSIGSGGVINNIENPTITNSKVDLIYGGNSDFNKSGIVLTTSGALNIDNVKMNNPKCDIQWVKLPAYTVDNDYFSASPSAAKNFWFATCGDPTNVPPEPENDNWLGTITEFDAISTCLDQNPGACTDTCDANCPAGNIYTRTFVCSNPVVYKCTSGYTTQNMYNTYGVEAGNTTNIDIWNGVSGHNGACDGLIRRYPAAILTYGGSANQQILPYPIDSRLEDQRRPSHNTISGALAAATLRPYCGLTFNKMGNNSSHYITYAQDATELMMNNPQCSHGDTALTLCYQLANTTYDTFNSWRATYDYNGLCEQIAAHHSGLGNNFSCILNPTSPTGHTYFKTTNAQVVTEQHRPCKNGTCKSTGNNTNINVSIYTGTYCKMLKPVESFSIAKNPDNFIPTYKDTYNGKYAGFTSVNYSTNQSGKIDYTHTHYLNKKVAAQQLNCSK